MAAGSLTGQRLMFPTLKDQARFSDWKFPVKGSLVEVDRISMSSVLKCAFVFHPALAICSWYMGKGPDLSKLCFHAKAGYRL